MTDLGDFMGWVERRLSMAERDGYVIAEGGSAATQRRSGRRQKMNRIPVSDRDIVALHQAGVTRSEIAERLGCIPSRVTLGVARWQGKAWAVNKRVMVRA